jgi:hypothetical protein
MPAGPHLLQLQVKPSPQTPVLPKTAPQQRNTSTIILPPAHRHTANLEIHYLQAQAIFLQLLHCCFTFRPAVLPAPTFSALCGTSSSPDCSTHKKMQQQQQQQ